MFLHSLTSYELTTPEEYMAAKFRVTSPFFTVWSDTMRTPIPFCTALIKALLTASFSVLPVPEAITTISLGVDSE